MCGDLERELVEGTVGKREREERERETYASKRFYETHFSMQLMPIIQHSTVKRLSLELIGNAPFIVHNSADIKVAV